LIDILLAKHAALNMARQNLQVAFIDLTIAREKYAYAQEAQLKAEVELDNAYKEATKDIKK